MIIEGLQSQFMYLPTFKRNNEHNNHYFNALINSFTINNSDL